VERQLEWHGERDLTPALGLPRVPPAYVPRPRLHALLDQAIEQTPVVLLVAPAVSGKTTLLAGWRAAGSSPPMAYVALDAFDDSVPGFWSKVIDALQGLHPGCGEAARDLLGGRDDTRRFLDLLLPDLAGLGPTVLVVDGLEALGHPTALAMLGGLLFGVALPFRVLLSSRIEPALRLGLLRARGQLADVHARHLAFDRTEMAEVLGHHLDGGPGGDNGVAVAPGGRDGHGGRDGRDGRDGHGGRAGRDGRDGHGGRAGRARLGPDEQLILHARTEGWAGGVQLAALALRGHPDPGEYVRSFTGHNRYVADLLATEVLAPQPPEVRDFLLTTSVLRTLDDGLCDAVTAHPGSAALLERLERSGLFLDAVDGEQLRYRYRPLFREFLRHELHLLDPAREQAAHRAAAAEHERRGEITPALEHHVAGGQGAAAVALVLDHGERCAGLGQVDRLRRWLASLPDEALTADTRRMLGTARLCLTAGMRDEAVMWLERSRLRLDATREPGLIAEHALLRGVADIHLGSIEAAVDQAERVLRLTTTPGPDEAERPAELRLRDRAHHLLAAAYTALDEFETARRHRDAAPHDDDGGVPADAYSAWLCYREGHLEQAVGHADQLLEHSTLPWRWATPLAARGGVLRERNQLDAAVLDLSRAMELAEQWWRPPVFVFAAIELALLRFAQGSTAEAFELLAEARTRAHGVHLRQRLDATDAALWLRAGDLERARVLRRELPAGRLTALFDARLLLARGEVARSLVQIEAVEAGARSLQDRIGARLVRARALLADDEPAARDELHRAVELGRWEGFVQLFTEDLVELEGLLRGWLGEGDDPYSFGLLAAVADRGRGCRPGPVADGVRPVAVDELSSRERVVLHYLATSLANKEIAGELHMSVNTLKTHLKSIYRKLGARTRQAAVAAGRQQRLL
jgi:LuxR family maltose regulon positive regulatory protein